MLNALILECSRESALSLTQNIKEVIAKFSYHIQIKLTTSEAGKVLDLMESSEGSYMVFIGLGLYPPIYNGYDAAKKIREMSKESYMVFIADNADCAYLTIQGLIRPSGFLIKPIKMQEIQLVITDIYRDYLNQSNGSKALSINIGTDIYYVDYDEILYFESMQKKIYVFTANQRISYYDSLTSLESRLDERFIRCHKSYIVNRDKIKSILFSEMRIFMENEAEIGISRTYKNDVKEKIRVID